MRQYKKKVRRGNSRDRAQVKIFMEQPIITRLTDNDIYTFSVCYLYLAKFPRACGRYTFIDRNGDVYPQGFAE
ncbi:MAG: hypothetical protein LBV79_10535, partial [Candidatus Adiutrix sp.]|nr:hypothetical protein [Candidatus Adiutrix sp.]